MVPLFQPETHHHNAMDHSRTICQVMFQICSDFKSVTFSLKMGNCFTTRFCLAPAAPWGAAREFASGATTMPWMKRPWNIAPPWRRRTKVPWHAVGYDFFVHYFDYFILFHIISSCFITFFMSTKMTPNLTTTSQAMACGATWPGAPPRCRAGARPWKTPTWRSPTCDKPWCAAMKPIGLLGFVEHLQSPSLEKWFVIFCNFDTFLRTPQFAQQDIPFWANFQWLQLRAETSSSVEPGWSNVGLFGVFDGHGGFQVRSNGQHHIANYVCRSCLSSFCLLSSQQHKMLFHQVAKFCERVLAKKKLLVITRSPPRHRRVRFFQVTSQRPSPRGPRSRWPLRCPKPSGPRWNERRVSEFCSFWESWFKNGWFFSLLVFNVFMALSSEQWRLEINWFDNWLEWLLSLWRWTNCSRQAIGHQIYLVPPDTTDFSPGTTRPQRAQKAWSLIMRTSSDFQFEFDHFCLVNPWCVQWFFPPIDSWSLCDSR